MCTSRGEDHFQTPADIEEQADASEAEDPNGEKKRETLSMKCPAVTANSHTLERREGP